MTRGRIGRFFPLILAPAAFASIALSTSSARAEEGICTLDSLRIAVIDAGATSTVELSAHVRPGSGDSATCTIAWSRLTLAGVASGGTPTVAIADGFVDHARIPPLVLANGLDGATPRDFHGKTGPQGAVVALRLVVEGTEAGIRLEVPRSIFPSVALGAKVERRVKSARRVTAKFGDLGELEIQPTDAGPAGGLGPTGPIDERIVVEAIAGAEPPSAIVPAWARVLDGFRQTFAQQVLDLSPANQAAWDELARRAYAASVHGDPVLASLGESSVAWLASGLDLKAMRLAKTAALPEVAQAPQAVLDAIGDVAGRLEKRYGAVGHLLPLGRPAVFRRVLTASPWNEGPRAQAAKDAVARLGTLSPVDLAAYVTPGIMDANAPIDPPAAGPLQPMAKPLEPEEEPGAMVVADKKHTRHARRGASLRKKVLLGIALAAAMGALIVWLRARFGLEAERS